jgi:hypothetical protein
MTTKEAALAETQQIAESLEKLKRIITKEKGGDTEETQDILFLVEKMKKQNTQTEKRISHFFSFSTYSFPLQMKFGDALEALKQGKKLQRAGWNGKGMWIVLMPELYLPPASSESNPRVNERTAKYIGQDAPLDSQPYLAMWTAAKQWQPGWLASQADMLAEDWQIVE